MLAAACVATLAPCGVARADAAFRPYASGFSGITYIAANRAEPRRLYVVEQVGRVRYLVDGRARRTFLDIRSLIASGGEQGLLSIAFHPAYATNHRFYVDYTDLAGNTRVVEYRSRRGVALRSSARQLLFVRQPYANHNGGQLQFGPDGRLYLGMGDGGSGGDPGNRAQNLSVRLGKLLSTVPTAGRPRWRIAAYGLRNPWRFSFDRAGGDLYIGDVGQNALEEVDYRPRAQVGALANYGWSVYEGRSRFRPGTPSGSGELVFPIQQYGHREGCSITGGYVYRGRAVTESVGRYFYGDYCSGTIWSLRVEGGRAADVRKEPTRVASLTSFGEDAAGELYAATGDGKILRLRP